MAYKKVADRASKTEVTFKMGPTRTLVQKNGVRSTTTRAIVQDGIQVRDVNIFANGGRLDAIEAALVEGNVARLRGVFSQRNTFVALGLAN